MSPLERTWWFVALVCGLATICTRYLLDSVGFPPTMSEFGVAQWTVYILCSVTVWRAISFAVWLVVLGISPSTAGARTLTTST